MKIGFEVQAEVLAKVVGVKGGLVKAPKGIARVVQGETRPLCHEGLLESVKCLYAQNCLICTS